MRISDWSSDVCSSDLELLRLAEITVEHHAVADEAEAVARNDTDLLDALRDFHAGQQGLRRRLAAADDLEQAHDMRRREEMETDHLVGPARGSRPLVDRETGRVGGADGVRRRHAVALGKALLLEPPVLEPRPAPTAHT